MIKAQHPISNEAQNFLFPHWIIHYKNKNLGFLMPKKQGKYLRTEEIDSY